MAVCKGEIERFGHFLKDLSVSPVCLKVCTLYRLPLSLAARTFTKIMTKLIIPKMKITDEATFNNSLYLYYIYRTQNRA